MQRALGVLVVSFIVQLALVACGGGTDKPPLTPDDPTAGFDAGSMDTPAVAPADPAAAPIPPK
ncbi:MAG: hypothetical protein ABI461_08060 [Polyangiaceae bacterium]